MDYKKSYDSWIRVENLAPNLKQELLDMTETEIKDAFYKNLEFQTAGMRGVIGAGTNRMNLYTIRKANIGFAKFLLASVVDVKTRGVVIAFDNRHMSKEFALESAQVMSSFGIKAYLFDELRPTPELSFAVRHLKAAGGIMITASHNPPEYNGYKIYNDNGAQLMPEDADKVTALVNDVQNIFDINIQANDNLIKSIHTEIDDVYLKAVKTIQLNPNINKDDLRIIYTPLHGTGESLIPKILSECGYSNVHLVAEQMIVDPNFSACPSPNPESHEAFELAIEQGKKVNADLLIATDPDADRVGIAVKNNEGKYVILTGNQTGALMIHYILEQRKTNGTLPKNGKIFDTIVTSKLGSSIGRDYGVGTHSTLTGFKFIGEKARLMEGTDEEFLFGYEESYGYVVKDFVRDKDAVQAVLMCAEMAAFYAQSGQSLFDVLQKLYGEYGFYKEDLINLTLTGADGAEKIEAIMSKFRDNPLTSIAGLDIASIEDYQSSLAKNVQTGSVTEIALPKSNVLKYILEDGSWFALRPSGTEPKLKIYISIVSKSEAESLERVNKIKNELNTLLEN